MLLRLLPGLRVPLLRPAALLLSVALLRLSLAGALLRPVPASLPVFLLPVVAVADVALAVP